MKLPKQVQAQAHAAEAFDNNVRAANQPAPDLQPTVDTEVVETPTPAVAPVAASAPSPAPVAAPPEDEVWKARFQSLQGKYNAEVPRLHQQVADLTESLKALTKKAETEKPAAPDKQKKLVTKEDVDAFGSDLVEMTRRVAREEFGEREESYQQRISELQQELQAARGEVGQVVEDNAQKAKTTFFKELAGALPQWEQIQSTAECQAWLGTRVPGQRHTWNDALVAAAQSHDVESVVEVFGVFFEKNPAHNPKKPAAAPAAQSSANRELQRQVTPSRTSASQQTPQKRVYSASEYEAESMRQMRFFQVGKYAESQAIETELNLALAEGRVR